MPGMRSKAQMVTLMRQQILSRLRDRTNWLEEQLDTLRGTVKAPKVQQTLEREAATIKWFLRN